VCGARDVLLPYVALPCRHIFCYYCLRSNCAADAAFACPVDGVRVRGLQRLLRCVPPDD
jgi:peroxin-2